MRRSRLSAAVRRVALAGDAAGATPGFAFRPPRWSGGEARAARRPMEGTIFQLKYSGFRAPSSQRHLLKWEDNMTQSQLIQSLADKCEIAKKVSKDLLTMLAETAISDVKRMVCLWCRESADWSG